MSANGSRFLHSAASHFSDLYLQASRPNPIRVIKDCSRTTTFEHVNPSGEFSYYFMTAGMNKHLGTSSTPPTDLTCPCIQYIEDHFTKMWDSTTCPRLHHEFFTDALVNVLAWTSWDHSREIFDLSWEDLEIILPIRGPTRVILMNVGTVLLTLNNSTKGYQT